MNQNTPRYCYCCRLYVGPERSYDAKAKGLMCRACHRVCRGRAMCVFAVEVA